LITSRFDPSQIIFGTSQICRLVSNKNIQNVLNCAFDCGIRHFDTARMYGFGEAEGKVGAFLKGRKEKCEIATKFGLKFNEPGYFKKKIFLLGRLFKGIFPKTSKGATQVLAPRQYLDFSVDSTLKSVDQSLRSLGVESIDFLFFHEPIASSIIDNDIFYFLEKLVISGKIKKYGISGSAPEILKIETKFKNFIKVKQFDSNILNKFVVPLGSDNFCFNVVGSVLKDKEVDEKIRLKKLDKNCFVSSLLHERLGEGCFKKVLFNSNKLNTIKSVVKNFVDSGINHSKIIREVFD